MDGALANRPEASVGNAGGEDQERTEENSPRRIPCMCDAIASHLHVMMHVLSFDSIFATNDLAPAKLEFAPSWSARNRPVLATTY